MSKGILNSVLAGVMALSAFGGSTLAAEGGEQKPLIQLAILLDTSNSMDGLISQAKTQLWKIVNEFATTKKGGVIPEMQVALYEYGNTRLRAGDGWIRQVLPLTTDLDKVSEQLFALKTSGGDEYCGEVIRVATEQLAWSASDKDLKVMVIAGNEEFTQGKVNYRESCKAAITKGIIINTIFCGSEAEGIRTNWKDGADLADGAYISIDQNRKVVAIAAPQDAAIVKLGAELNKTYVAYGKAGEAGANNQRVQDMNAAVSAPAVAAERSLVKASAQYRNESWDLVDAAKKGDLKLAEMKDEDLPDNMRKMTADERKAYIDKQTAERERIQREITKLNAEREKYIAVEMKKQATAGVDTFDSAMIKTLREQAEKKEFKAE
jgi:hypothetical protein